MNNDDLFVSELIAIPKLFHFVWIGDNQVPDQDQTWIKSWAKYHPDWKLIIWAENPSLINIEGVESRPIPPLINQDLYDNIDWVEGRVLIAAKSDIVRMEIVAAFGGIYMDTDVECFSNIEHLLQNVKLFYCDEWGPNIGANYMFGAIANHPAVWTLVRDLENHIKNPNKKGYRNILFETGPYYVAPILRNHPDCLIFPYMLFSSLSYYKDSSQVQVWPECTVANHHCTGKWFDRKRETPPDKFLLKE